MLLFILKMRRTYLLFFSGQGTLESTNKRPNINSVNTLEFLQSGNDVYPGKYTCEICFKEYQHKRNLSRHMMMHAGLRYSCCVCDNKFTRLFSLKTHLKTVHSLLQCSACFETFGLNDSSSHRCPNLWTNLLIRGPIDSKQIRDLICFWTAGIETMFFMFILLVFGLLFTSCFLVSHVIVCNKCVWYNHYT